MLSLSRVTSHPNQTGTPTDWTDIPNTHRTEVRIQFPGSPSNVDVMRYSDEIYHKRLTLAFGTSGNPELKLDGTTIATGAYTGGTITYTVTHNAISGSAETRTDDYGLAFNGMVSFAFSFGPCSKEAAEYHKRVQNELIRAAGGSVNYGSEPILAETNYMQFFTYMALISSVSDALGRIRKCAPIHRHHGGFCGYNGSAQYFYMSMTLGGSLKFSDLDAGVSNEVACMDAYTVLVNGTEGMTTRQQLKSDYVSSNSIMESAMPSVRYFLNTHIGAASDTCPSLQDKQVTPFLLRHTAAMQLLQSGMNRETLAQWLGLESVASTQPYLDANLAIKKQQIRNRRTSTESP